MRITQKNNKQKRKNTRSITVKAINTTTAKKEEYEHWGEGEKRELE
jgi:hypothetical protein